MALRYQTMGDLIPDLEQIRAEYESGQVRSATPTPGQRCKAEGGK